LSAAAAFKNTKKLLPLIQSYMIKQSPPPQNESYEEKEENEDDDVCDDNVLSPIRFH
jgi:hypothetical protein